MTPPAAEAATLGAAPVRERSPPSFAVGPLVWLRANLFSSWLSTAVTLLLAYFLISWTLSFLNWAVVNAIWDVPGTGQQVDTSACRAARGEGACWALIGEKYRFILFGLYPFDEQWRPAVVVVIFVALYVVSAMRRFWRKELALIWLAALTLIGVLMWGGVFGLP